MSLPFTHDQFLDSLAAYNTAWWPVSVVLWLATLWALIALRRPSARVGRAVALLLAAQWAWSGVVYHAFYFRPINSGAVVFAAAFVIEAIVLARMGFAPEGLGLASLRGGWARAGVGLVAYGLLYPALGLAAGLSYPRAPMFGVPCPTTLVTAGFLLMTARGSARVLTIVPVVWAAIGSSAAVLLGIRADLGLVVAAILMAVHAVLPRVRPAAIAPAR